MKKFFQTIGIISLLCFSFIYTEKTVTVVKELDEIMIRIKEESRKYRVPSVDATISGNSIIPGISGREVAIDKSYSRMKRYGRYNENLLEYTTIKPSISLEQNIDKYIIHGNKQKNMVSLMFLVESNDSIAPLLKVLASKNIKATFFLDGNWIEKNGDTLIKIINDGHEVGNLGYNYSYLNHSFAWSDTKIKQVSKQERGYCYSEQENVDTISICSLNSNYTVKPNIVTSETPFKTINDNLVAGSLIGLHTQDILETELPSIIDFIVSKGFKISTLEEHLSE